MEFMYIGAALFFSTFVQGFTSFGFSLVAIPLLSLFLDTKLIIIITVTYSLVINCIIIKKYYRDTNLKKILPLLISAIIFTFVGVSYLQTIDEYILTLVIGILLVIIGFINNFGIRFSLKKPENYYLPVGAVSGVLNGIGGIAGPPVLVFLSNIDLNRSQFKATLSSYFLTLNVVTILTYIYKGFYTPENLNIIWTYLPCVVVGTAIGVYTSTKVEEKLFKKIINLAIPVMGLNIVWKLLG
ncbi:MULTISPECIES: sulfite exporter TauE/SafE family protein [Psychrilyobacter]|uniref:Probable membrane transporter protein n=1 Tax=Psychrilyobacter piezotolerans TaxID=2293438 RepID=A0ABX9KJP9_9FUSO|nr:MULTISPECIES: sulfite exporter TauE/SafE family protein [Psychrilyobacter]MCS5423029.1 sulfite exporter TauE/SafE family protein [Psychrilyobacter sp. S5]NDI77206.1 sulfite exporter TauE/SafE family protein [Psychrilyobacter piezotolerans]RDE64196.1 sulfite exporter TauE/SafE family protein [Psychrilyobacter sp. S5]REI42288.1 sulfite exporter TauE/SafE family protein [Psychrilyobacter piezotolerans]